MAATTGSTQLGERLVNLPEGWTYTARSNSLEIPLTINGITADDGTESNYWNVVQDEIP